MTLRLCSALGLGYRRSHRAGLCRGPLDHLGYKVAPDRHRRVDGASPGHCWPPVAEYYPQSTGRSVHHGHFPGCDALGQHLPLLAIYVRHAGTTDLVELPLQWLPTIGKLGGLLAGACIYALAFRFDLGPLRITLCGIAIGAVMHAMALGLIAGWGSNRLEVLLDWLAGSLYARTWPHAVYLLPYTLYGLAMLPLIRRPLDLLRFDASVARSFGLN